MKLIINHIININKKKKSFYKMLTKELNQSKQKKKKISCRYNYFLCGSHIGLRDVYGVLD